MHPVRGNVLRTITLASASIMLVAGLSHAATFNLRADKGNLVMPGGRSVPVWGFGDGAAACGTADVTVPGPTLEVPSGDTQLTINVTNCLAQPVSITVPGWPVTPTPVFDTSTPPRVISFTVETPGRVGANSPSMSTYSFTNVRPGTFLYESGTDPSLQVQMGLYGPIIVRPTTASQAYDDTRSFYENEIVMVLSEIDANFHDIVAAGCYVPQGTPPAVCGANYATSTTFHRPNYHLINGRPYSDPYTPFAAGSTFETLLLRLLNAGLESHSMTLQGTRMEIIAQDGNFLTYPRGNLVSEIVAAGQTLDILIRPKIAGKYAFYDRRFNVTNAGAFPGGMISFLDVQQGTRTDSLAITAPPSGTPNPAESQAPVNLSVTATDGLGHTVQYAWRASCPSPLSSGIFSNPTVQNPTWTTPRNRTGVQQDCTIKLTASDGGWGLVQTASYVQHVKSTPHTIDVLTPPSGTPEPVASRGIVTISFAAEDSFLAHPLNVTWSASCPALSSNGSFSDTHAQTPTWMAPLNHLLTPQTCTLTVDMNDGAGGLTASRSFNETVNPSPHQLNILTPPSGLPNPAMPNATVPITFSAEDTRLHTLHFAWTASCPTLLSNGIFNNATLQNPTWTVPLNPTGALANCTLQVVVDDGAGGLTATRSYTQGVTYVQHLLNITVGPSAAANPVIAGNSVGLSVATLDTVSHGLAYSWSASCPLLPSNGIFDNPNAQNPNWTAPSNPTGSNKTCTMQVIVNDGAGLTAIGSFTETVGGPCSVLPVLDNFTAAPLDTCWAFTDTRANSTRTFTGDGHYKITIPSTNSHDCWGNKADCARLLREAPNTDAVYETKVDGVNLVGKFSTYGIMLSQGTCNFLRFEYWSDQNGVFVKAYRVIGCNGSQVLATPARITMGATNHLRVTRTGDLFTLQYGTNLASLVTVGSFTQAGFTVAQAGVYLNNAADNPVTMGSFDYFKVTAPGGGTGPSHTLNITSGPSAVANPVESGARTGLLAAATDSLGHAIGAQWSVSCPTLPTSGSINNPTNLLTAEWNAPVNLTGSPQDCTLTLIINDGTGGLTQSTQFMGRVNSIPHTLTITAGPTGTPNPVNAVANVNLSVSASDSLAHLLHYTWSAACPAPMTNGTFNNAAAQNPVWTSPPNGTGAQQNCTLQVVVDDGAGGLTQTGTYLQAVKLSPHTLTITAGPTGTPNPVASGAVANLTVTATDTLGHAFGYAWSAVCTGLPNNGIFNNTGIRTPAWTAPVNITGAQKSCTIQVIVNDGAGGLTKTGSYTQTVNAAGGHTLGITVPPAGTPNPVASGGAASLNVTAIDSLGHTIGYAWSALCTGLPNNGSFNNAAIKTPAWTAPVNTTGVAQTCTIQVIVNDGAGGLTSTGSFIETVNAVPPPGACGTLPFNDPFTTGPLGACWSVVDPRANSSTSITADGHLRVSLPAGAPDHDCWNSAANCTRVMRAVPNVDAVYETKIDGVNLSGANHDYGILLFQDSCNYIRFEYWTAGSGVFVKAYSIAGCSGSQTITTGGAVALGGTNYLRVTKTGTLYKLEYSQNGTTWTSAGTMTRAGFTVSQVGFVAGDAIGNPATTGNADYFSGQ